MTFNVILVSCLQHDSIFVYVVKWLPWKVYLTSVTIHSYKSLFKIDSLSNFQICSTVWLTILLTIIHLHDLVCNWKFVPFDPFNHLAHPAPRLAITSLFSVYELGAAFLNSTYEWDHKVFVSLCLISLSLVPSKFIHIVENGKNSFFLMAE